MLQVRFFYSEDDKNTMGLFGSSIFSYLQFSFQKFSYVYHVGPGFPYVTLHLVIGMIEFYPS